MNLVIKVETETGLVRGDRTQAAPLGCYFNVVTKIRRKVNCKIFTSKLTKRQHFVNTHVMSGSSVRVVGRLFEFKMDSFIKAFTRVRIFDERVGR